LDKSDRYNVFDFTISRRRDGPNEFLGNYNQVLLADAYGAYGGICMEKQITKAGCWAHARRKFVDCQKVAGEICAQALGLMGKLFAVERSAKEKELDAAGTLALRQEKSLPVIQTLREELQTWKLRVLPRHPVMGAIDYVLNQWEPLGVFLKDGAVALDNNLSEQEMKRIALLRKNALFVGTERGGTTAAILSSMTSTCRRLGVNPQAYLTQTLMGIGSTPMSQVEQWLPDVWQKRVASESPVAE
jgi:transposase